MNRNKKNQKMKLIDLITSNIIIIMEDIEEQREDIKK